MMTNSDPKGQIFLSYPYTNNRFFSFIKFCNKLPEVLYYSEMQYFMMSHWHNNDIIHNFDDYVSEFFYNQFTGNTCVTWIKEHW